MEFCNEVAEKENKHMREKVIDILREINDELVEDLERDLFESGILDSFDIVKLVLQLEDGFGITIGVEKVTSENFRTVEAIVNMIENII